MTGIPCSGKTNRTNELKKFFEMEKGKKVTIISEEEMIQKAMFDKNNFYTGKSIIQNQLLLFFIYTSNCLL
jgi:tRNA uridine 5-carbamoylmethylation protein Kti12